MQGKAMRRRQAGLSFKRVLGAVFVIALLGFWTMRHANFVLGRAMLLAFPQDDTTYKAAWPSLTGTVTARDVMFPAPDGSGLAPFHFDEVRVEVPMWEYLRSGFSRKRGSMLNAITEVRITLRGGSGEYGLPFTAMLGVFGASSASPFEAEGCSRDTLWAGAELGGMGLNTGPTELVVYYKRDKDSLTLEETLHTPGAARVSYHGRMQMNDRYSLFSLLDGGKNAVVSDSWSVTDEGFVAARNRYCAGQDKITPEQFVERHLAAVQRQLATLGLRAGPDMAAAYRSYASKGGTLELSLDYQPPLTAELYEDENLGNWLPRLQGKFSLDGKPLAFGLESRPVKELPEPPEGEFDMTTLAVLQAEGADPLQQAGGGIDPAVSASVPASIPAAATAAVPASAAAAATGTGRPESTSSFLQDPPLPAAATPAVAIVRPGSAAAAATPAAQAATAPPPIVRPGSAAATATVPASSAAASVSVSSAVAPTAPQTTVVTASARPSPAALETATGGARLPPGTRVDYAQLGKMIGQQARIHMKTRPPMQGLVVREEKGVVYLRRHLGSGYAVLEIDKAGFDYAEALQ
jgi:hypothetical protein